MASKSKGSSSSKSRVVMEEKLDNILVQILDCPFIERQQVDVIVNSISPTLHLSGRKLSSAIKAAAGQGLERALQALPEKPQVGDVLVTSGYGLRCKHIYHVVATGYYTKNSERLMEKSVLQCLRMADTNGMASIALPALGTGGLNLLPEVVAKRMLRAVTKFKSSATSLREVRFALIGTDMRVAFIKELSKGFDVLDSIPSIGDDSAPPVVSVTIPIEVLDKIRSEFAERRPHCLQEPFIPWRWAGTLHPDSGQRESEWLDALQEDLFMVRPRSPIVIHGVTGIGRSRFLTQIQELWYQGSLPKFKCVLHVSAFGILFTESLWRVIANHLVDQVGLDEMQAVDLLTEHGNGMLVLLDDADILSSETLRQTLNEQRLSNVNFVFSTRTPDAPRLLKCLNPSDIVKLHDFTPVEVERFINKALEGNGALDHARSAVVETLISKECLPFARIPGYLSRICNVVKELSETDLRTHLKSLHDLYSFCLWGEPYIMIKGNNKLQSAFSYLQTEGVKLGKILSSFANAGKRPHIDTIIIPVTDSHFRYVMDFALAQSIVKFSEESKGLASFKSLDRCLTWQTSLEIACGMSKQAAEVVQKRILYLADRDSDVQNARAKILGPIDEESATTLLLLSNLEGRCRMEAGSRSGAKNLEGVPVELQYLGAEYVLAYKRACADGSQPVFRTRVMLVGHFGAGKTSVKRRLVSESFHKDYSRTNGIEADPSACKVVVDNTCNWKLDRANSKVEGDNEYIKEVAKLLHSLMQQLQPSQVGLKKVKEPSLDAVNSMLREIGDQLEDTFKPWLDRTMRLKQKRLGPLQGQPNEGLLSNVDDIDGSLDQSQDDEEGLLLAELPAEVLQELRHLMEAANNNDAQQEEGHMEIKLSFWDFAGQTVFYTTHQTFLTHRAIYIVVLDLTKPLEARIETYRQGRRGQTLDRTCPQTVADYLDYWLSCIHTHAVSSNYKSRTSATLSPPIIIVGTHRDVLEQQFPDSYQERIDNYYSSVHKYIERKAYFDHVHLQFFSLANSLEDDPELDKLKQKIVTLAKEEPYWGEEIPLKWIALRDRLRKLKQEGISVTDQNKAFELAKEVGISDQGETCAVLKFYHELGDCVFFDEPNLRDFIVLDPQWLIDAFRRVITIEQYHDQLEFLDGRRQWRILEEHGVLHDSILDHVWDVDLKEQLVTLMYKFRLLLPLPHEQLADVCPELLGNAGQNSRHGSGGTAKNHQQVSYLVPCLLPPLDDVPDLPANLPPMLVIFREEFLPVGVMSRLVIGLVTECGWALSGQVFHNFAVFLPDGVDADVSVSLYQCDGMLEVQGRYLGTDSSNISRPAVFKPYLQQLLALLETVVSMVCPMARFTLAVWCHCHNIDHHRRSLVEVGLDGEQLEGKQSVYCRHHWKKFPTTAFAHWFSVEEAELTHDTPADYPSDRTLLRLAEGIGQEWRRVAIYLGLTDAACQQARLANPHDIVMCTLQILVRWRNGCTLVQGNERLSELQDALRSANRVDLAESLDQW